jgi:branched-subunit amino acid transport protein AzlD
MQVKRKLPLVKLTRSKKLKVRMHIIQKMLCNICFAMCIIMCIRGEKQRQKKFGKMWLSDVSLLFKLRSGNL